METLWLPATETWIDGAGHLGFQMSRGGIYGGILQRATSAEADIHHSVWQERPKPGGVGPTSAEICTSYRCSLSVRDGENAELVQDRNLGGSEGG